MVYVCAICGSEYDEEKQGIPASSLSNCPMCGAEARYLKPKQAEGENPVEAPLAVPAENPLAYPPELAREDPRARHMADIHEMAVTGSSIIAPMAAPKVRPSWDDVLILGAQLDPPPLEEHTEVDTRVVIGKSAKQPMALTMPVFVSHMSFGALSQEAKVALARGAALAGTAVCSGEGGILPAEREAAYRYIFEVVPNRYSVTDDNLQCADAVEIKIGQGTKPGMGGHLPGEKVTGEIAAIRGKPQGQDIISPSVFPGMDGKAGLKRLVEELRERSQGRPVGVKVAAGHIERDLAAIVWAGADFVTVDGRGGATGASPKLVRDATSLPTLYALARARKYLDSLHSKIELIITGGLRVSSDFAKALALGADAIAVASAPLMAAGCQQYRLCNTGLCPMGLATQDPALRERVDVGTAAERVHNYLRVAKEELATFARITGHTALRELGPGDLCTTDADIAQHTGIAHA